MKKTMIGLILAIGVVGCSRGPCKVTEYSLKHNFDVAHVELPNLNYYNGNDWCGTIEMLDDGTWSERTWWDGWNHFINRSDAISKLQEDCYRH